MCFYYPQSIYTVVYNGEAYFADEIFHLTDEQKLLATDYANNLSLFLGDSMFQGKMKAITFSYDDGVTQDVRLAELFRKEKTYGDG